MTKNQQDKLRLKFFDEADTLFAIFDENLNFLDANVPFLKKLRLNKKDVIGKNITEISPDNKSSGRYELYKEVIRTGKPLIIDEIKPHPKLGNFYVRVKAFKVGNGFGTVSNDITDLKQIINDDITELETFIFQSTHDLRVPISNIIGMMDLAGMDIQDVAKAKRFCEEAKEQAERLNDLLTTLLETNKIRSKEKTRVLIDFNQLISDVENSLSYGEGFKDVKIGKQLSFEGEFYSDPYLITSLFQNLIDNAIKYKKEKIKNSFVKIAVTNERQGVKITVADNGIGIPADLHKDVFKMFFRASNKIPGSGLGLYTVCHAVKRLGGHIEFKSKEKVGTTFMVYLPNEK